MRKQNSYILIVLLYITGISAGYSQNFAPKEQYLVDSLDLKTITGTEILFLDSCLTEFHTTNLVTKKIAAINLIVETSNSMEVWPKYNKWVYNYIRQIKSELKGEPEEEFVLLAEADALNNLGYLSQINGRYKASVGSYTRSFDIYFRLKDSLRIANSLNNLGSAYYNLGEIKKCLDYYRNSLKIRAGRGDKEGVANSLNNIGIIFQEQGDPSTALSYFVKSLKIREELGDAYLMATVLSNIGLCHLEIDEADKGLKYFRRALALDKSSNNQYGIAVSQFNIGRCLKLLTRYDKALEKYETSLNLFSKEEYKKENTNCLNSIAEVYYLKGNIDQAISYYSKAIAFQSQANYNAGLSNSYEGLSKCYLILKQLNKAKDYAEKSLILAQEQEFPDQIKKTAFSLAAVEEKMGDYATSLIHYKLYKIMNDSVVNIETKKAIAIQEVTLLLEDEIKVQEINYEQELKFLNEKASLQMRIIMIIIVSLILLTSLLVLLVNKLKVNKLQREALKKSNHKIEVKNHEKEILLKEIHHRVKNNMQIVTSLLRLNSNKIKDLNAQAVFDDCQNRIKSMSLIHQQLYGDGDLAKINVKKYVEVVVQELMNSYNVSSGINMEYQLDEVSYDLDISVPFGLILNELVVNSLKYAFPKGEGTISIRLINNTGNVALVVKDNGSGFNTQKVREGSLGLELVETLAEQIEGDFSIESSEIGTSCQLKFSI